MSTRAEMSTHIQSLCSLHFLREMSHLNLRSYLIIYAHVYSVLPEGMHLHTHSFLFSPLNAPPLCSLLLLPWNSLGLTTIMHLNDPHCNRRTYYKGWAEWPHSAEKMGDWFSLPLVNFQSNLCRMLSTRRDLHFIMHTFLRKYESKRGAKHKYPWERE